MIMLDLIQPTALCGAVGMVTLREGVLCQKGAINSQREEQ